MYACVLIKVVLVSINSHVHCRLLLVDPKIVIINVQSPINGIITKLKLFELYISKHHLVSISIFFHSLLNKYFSRLELLLALCSTLFFHMVVLFAMHIEWYYFSGILLIEETVRIYCYSFRIFLFIVDSFVAPNRSRLYCIYGIRLYSIGITCELQGVRRSDAFFSHSRSYRIFLHSSFGFSCVLVRDS